MDAKAVNLWRHEVRNALANGAGQFRRVVKPQFGKTWGHGVRLNDDAFSVHVDIAEPSGEWKWIKCPYGKPGDRLWVRETWSDVNTSAGPGIAYKADNHFWQPDYDGEDFGGGPSYNYDKYPGEYVWWYEDLISGVEGKWRPSIHMPRWASRITLEVTEVRVERVQDISEGDAIAEGVEFNFTEDEKRSRALSGCDYVSPIGWKTPVEAFAELWDSINGKKHPWESNPWVWAITFQRVEP